jgi:hypothetical protein
MMQRAAWGRAGTLLQGGRSRAGTGAGAAPGGTRNTSASSREGGISEEKEEEEQHYLRWQQREQRRHRRWRRASTAVLIPCPHPFIFSDRMAIDDSFICRHSIKNIKG